MGTIFQFTFLTFFRALTLYTGSTLNNNGTMNILGTSASIGYSGSGNFNNYGIISIPTFTINLPFYHNGTLSISTLLNLNGGGTSIGNITISSGASLSIGGSTTTFSSGYISGLGSITITGPSVYFYAFVTVPTFTISSGTAFVNSNFSPSTITILGILQPIGTATISSGTSITCSSGGTIQGPGMFILSSGTTLNIGTSGTPGSESISNIVINSYGTINFYG